MRSRPFVLALVVLAGCPSRCRSGEPDLAAAEASALATVLGGAAADLPRFDREGFARGENGILVENGHVVALRLRRAGIERIAGVAGLDVLRELDLSGNAIRAIEGLERASALEVVTLRENKLTSLAGLSGCIALRQLDVTGNALASTAELPTLPALTTLVLANNKLASLPGLAGRQALDLLDLGGNRLESAAEIHDLPGVRSLVLSRNHLATLDGLRDLPRLEHLFASDNVLADASAASVLPSLRTLDLERNRLSLAPATPVACKVALGGNPLATAPPPAGSGPLGAEAAWVAERPPIGGSLHRGFGSGGRSCTVAPGGALSCAGRAERLAGTPFLDLVRSASADRHVHVDVTVKRGRVAVYLAAADARGGFRVAVAEPGKPARVSGYLERDGSKMNRMVLSAVGGDADDVAWDVRSGVGPYP